MKRENWKRKILSTVLACSLSASIVSGVPAQGAGKKVPTLSEESKDVKVKKSFTLKLKKNQTKKIVCTTWKASNKKVTLSKKKKMSVRIMGKKAGTSQITATVTYKNGGSQKKKKIKCRVVVKKEASATPSATPTATPAATADTTEKTKESALPSETADTTEKPKESALPSETADTTEKPKESALPSETVKDEDTVGDGMTSYEGYKLDKVVVLSRHNIRSPLSGGNSLLGTITPHDWFTWTSNPSELSLRGGVLETQMGQYFRKWLEREGLFPQNARPESGEVLFYANSKQRTIATARYFSSGLFPVANEEIVYKTDYDTMNPVFTPQFTFVSDEYAAAVKEQMKELFADDIAGLANSYSLISDVVDFKDSWACKSGTVKNLQTEDYEFAVENLKEPSVKGSLATACSISDALVLQYYEESNPVSAAFGHTITEEDWKEISKAKDTYQKVLFTAPLVSKNIANPLLKQIREEMGASGRKFSFLCGHDSNIASVLSALEVEDYSLPYSIERETPIGSKVVWAEYSTEEGKKYWDIDLVYQTTRQLRTMPILDLAHPPAVYPLSFENMERNEDGLYAAEDVEKRLQEAIEDYDELLSEYSVMEPAA